MINYLTAESHRAILIDQALVTESAAITKKLYQNPPMSNGYVRVA